MEIKDKYKNLSIDEIELPVRYANMFNNANIRTLGELEAIEFTKYRNFTARVMREINDLLEPYIK